MPLAITDEEKVRVTHRAYSLFTQHGFDGISMDEVARQIGLSKATVYKYFKSKEDIVRDMVHEVTSHLDSLQFTTEGGIDSVLESLSAIYSKAVIVAAYSSSKFITDLASKHPDILADYMTSLDNAQFHFKAFYKGAVQEGYCRKVSIDLVGEQVMRMLPAVIAPEYLERHNTTLPEIVKEYYKLLLYLLLSPRHGDIIEQENTYRFVDNAVEILKGRFLIDDNQ